MAKKQNLAQRNNRRRRRGLVSAKGAGVPDAWLIATGKTNSYYYRNQRETTPKKENT